MQENSDFSFDDDIPEELITKYEKSTKTGAPAFFDVEDYEMLFFHYLNSGELTRASSLLHQAQNQHPGNTELLFLETEYYLRKNRFSQALETINQIIEKEPYNTEALISKSNVLVHCNRVDDAVKLLFKTLDTDTDIEDAPHVIMDFAYRLIDSEHIARAPEILQEAIKYPENEDEAICEMVYVYEILEMPNKAVSFLNDYLSDNPYSYTAWNNLGMIYLGQKEYQKALRAYDLCTAIHDTDPMGYFNKAMCLRALKEYDEAIENLKESLKHERNVKSLYLKNIGDLYVETENYYEAEKYYLKACRTEEKFFGNEITTGCFIALAKITAIQDRIKEAENFARKAVKENPERFDAFHTLANILDQADADEAEDHYLKAIKIAPGNDLVYIDYSDFLYRRGREEDAFQVLSEAAKELEIPTNLIYQLGMLNFKSNHFNDAYDLFCIAFEDDPELTEKLLIDVPEIVNYTDFQTLLDDFSH